MQRSLVFCFACFLLLTIGEEAAAEAKKVIPSCSGMIILHPVPQHCSKAVCVKAPCRVSTRLGGSRIVEGCGDWTCLDVDKPR
jgi:hypothetical protein